MVCISRGMFGQCLVQGKIRLKTSAHAALACSSTLRRPPLARTGQRGDAALTGISARAARAARRQARIGTHGPDPTRRAQGPVRGRRGQRDDAQGAGRAVRSDRHAQLGGRGGGARGQLARVPAAPARARAYALPPPGRLRGCGLRPAPRPTLPYPTAVRRAPCARSTRCASARLLPSRARPVPACARVRAASARVGRPPLRPLRRRL
jgi:hypothetical protein